MGGLFEKPVFRTIGDTGVLVEYGDAIDPEINRKVRSMSICVDQDTPPGVVEIIPTYRSLLLVYDPSVIELDTLKQAMAALEARLEQIEIPPPKTVEIPVLYGGEMGPDLDFVAEHNGLSVDDVIRLHTEPLYQIYMIGFTPGFAFLGGLPKALATPRLPTPRTSVPKGSVGIANDQTGMYPIASPGGWRLIGRTPFNLFDPDREEPFLYEAGDRIQFKRISQSEYDTLLQEGAS